MRIEINGMERLKGKVKRLTRIIKDSIYEGTLEIVEEISANAQSRIQSSTKHGSGESAGSVKNEVVIDNTGNVVGRVWSDKQQLLFRELGTGPVGEESPKKLPPGITPVYSQERWFIPADSVAIDLEAIYGIPKITIQGKDFFMSRGQPARPWLYPSFYEMEEQVPGILKEHIKESLKKL